MVEDKIIYKIKNEILNFEYYEPTRATTSVKHYTELFFTNIEKNENRLNKYIEAVVEVQGKYLIDCVKNKKDVIIPNLGTFKYNYNKDYKNKVLSGLSEDLDEVQKQEILKDKFRTLKIAKSKNNIHKNMLNTLLKNIHIK